MRGELDPSGLFGVGLVGRDFFPALAVHFTVAEFDGNRHGAIGVPPGHAFVIVGMPVHRPVVSAASPRSAKNGRDLLFRHAILNQLEVNSRRS